MIQHCYCEKKSSWLTFRMEKYNFPFSGHCGLDNWPQSQNNWYEQVKGNWGHHHAKFENSHLNSIVPETSTVRFLAKSGNMVIMSLQFILQSQVLYVHDTGNTVFLIALKYEGHFETFCWKKRVILQNLRVISKVILLFVYIHIVVIFLSFQLVSGTSFASFRHLCCVCGSACRAKKLTVFKFAPASHFSLSFLFILLFGGGEVTLELSLSPGKVTHKFSRQFTACFFVFVFVFLKGNQKMGLAW